jgi:hypothetical protein
MATWRGTTNMRVSVRRRNKDKGCMYIGITISECGNPISNLKRMFMFGDIRNVTSNKNLATGNKFFKTVEISP